MQIGTLGTLSLIALLVFALLITIRLPNIKKGAVIYGTFLFIIGVIIFYFTTASLTSYNDYLQIANGLLTSIIGLGLIIGGVVSCEENYVEVDVEVIEDDAEMEMIYEVLECPLCGAEAPLDAEICPSCGVEFENE